MKKLNIVKVMLLCCYFITTSNTTLQASGLDVEDPRTTAEHQAIMKYLRTQTDGAEQEVIRRTIATHTSDNLLQDHEAKDRLYDTVRKNNEECTVAAIERNRFWQHFHGKYKGIVGGSGNVLVGVAGGFYLISLIGPLGCDLQNDFSVVAASIGAVGAVCKFLGHHMNKAYVNLTTEMNDIEKGLGNYLGPSMEEIKRRGLENQLSTDIFIEGSIPRSGSHDELSQMASDSPILVRKNSKGKEEDYSESELLPGQREEDESTPVKIVVDHIDNDGSLTDGTGQASVFVSIPLVKSGDDKKDQ